MNEDIYDVVILGAGVSGAAEFYALAEYSSVKKVLIIEKEKEAGSVNSAPTNNSQTLHEGDIETNYSLEKAKSAKAKAHFTRAFLEKKEEGTLYMKGPKMVLGIGEKERTFLRERFESFNGIYPGLRQLEKEELEKVEPNICKGRSGENVLTAIYNPDGITVNYQNLAVEFIKDALGSVGKDREKKYKVLFNSTVQKIQKEGGYYVIYLENKVIKTRFLSVCAGAHSMYFAKQLGVKSANDMSLLCVAGNFYYTPKYLTSKVYTVQDPNLPFSAVHGDPDILDTTDSCTRFGPTTRVIFMLERYRFDSVFDFLKVISPIRQTIISYLRVLIDKEFFFYSIKHNILFQLPFLGTYLFAKEVRKIIPSIKTSEVRRAKCQGGVRPQIIHVNSKNPLSLGEAKFSGENVMFNVTPSPGATTCLYNGLIDSKKIANDLGETFETKRIFEDFGAEPK